MQIDNVDASNATDEWIDALFHRFDEDNSGTIDDAEWEHLSGVLKEEAAKIGTEDSAERRLGTEARATSELAEASEAAQAELGQSSAGVIDRNAELTAQLQAERSAHEATKNAAAEAATAAEEALAAAEAAAAAVAAAETRPARSLSSTSSTPGGSSLRITASQRAADQAVKDTADQKALEEELARARKKFAEFDVSPQAIRQFLVIYGSMLTGCL
jgi:hypothetical protein